MLVGLRLGRWLSSYWQEFFFDCRKRFFIRRPVTPWLHPEPKFSGLGPDENLYRVYLDDLRRVGLTAYPDIVDNYIEQQKVLPAAVFPPVRFLYIFFGYAWQSLFETDPLSALRNVSAAFSMFTLLISVVAAQRLKGPIYGIGIAALMGFAPTQLHMS